MYRLFLKKGIGSVHWCRCSGFKPTVPSGGTTEAHGAAGAVVRQSEHDAVRRQLRRQTEETAEETTEETD